MTKKLEETFNIDPDYGKEQTPVPQETMEDYNALTEFEGQLKDVYDLSKSDRELDDLAKKAVESFEDLMDLGKGVEPRFSAAIFDSASKMIGHAITAKTTKVDKKLRAMDIKLKERRLELAEKQAKLDDGDESSQGNSYSRNDLLEMIKKANQDK